MAVLHFFAVRFLNCRLLKKIKSVIFFCVFFAKNNPKKSVVKIFF